MKDGDNMVVSFDEVMQLAEQLSQAEQDLLVHQLMMRQMQRHTYNPTRDELINELNVLRLSGAFKNVESLYGKYANPDISEVSEDEFHTQMHAISTEWEQELDDFNPSDNP